MSDFSKRVLHLLDRDQDLYEQRNAVYEDNHILVGKIMDLLFGVVEINSPEQHQRHHILELFVVKLTRYAMAARRGDGHRDSLQDMRVYLAILEIIEEEMGLYPPEVVIKSDAIKAAGISMSSLAEVYAKSGVDDPGLEGIRDGSRDPNPHRPSELRASMAPRVLKDNPQA